MRKFIIFIIFLYFFLLLNIAFAIEIIQIDQPKIRLSITPGGTKAGVINVVNPSTEAKSTRVYLEDWYYLPNGDGSKEFRPAGSLVNSCSSWISFTPAEFILPAYGRQRLNYTVKIPPDAKGGHYAVMFFENYLGEQKAATEGVNVNLAIRVASLFYIEPEGMINRNANISDLKISKKENKFYVTAKFSNTGNVDITAKGTFFIIDQKGMVYARGEFNEVYTFPQDTATLASNWKEPIPKGKYDLILTIDIGKALEEAGLGRGPVIIKEAQIEIGENDRLIKVGELR